MPQAGNHRFRFVSFCWDSFDDSKRLRPLQGIKHDERRMSDMFRSWGYEVENHFSLLATDFWPHMESNQNHGCNFLVIYMSSHGANLKPKKKAEQFVVLPKNAAFDEGTNCWAAPTVIAGERLLEKIKSLKCARQLLILDTCHSGSVGTLKDVKVSPSASDSLFCTVPGLAILTATLGTESALANPQGSPFTQRLVDSWSSAEDFNFLALVRRLHENIGSVPFDGAHSMTPMLKCDAPRLDEWNLNPTVEMPPPMPAEPQPAVTVVERKAKREREPALDDRAGPDKKKFKLDGASAPKKTSKKPWTSICPETEGKHQLTDPLQSKTKDNPGRYFHKCQNCKYFNWLCPPASYFLMLSVEDLQALASQMNIKWETLTREKVVEKIRDSYPQSAYKSRTWPPKI